MTAIAGGKKKNEIPNPLPSVSLSNNSPNGVNDIKPDRPRSDCNSVIAKCDRALEMKNKALAEADKTIKQAKDLSVGLQKEVDDDQNKLKSPVRNPFFMAGAGAAVGLVVGGPIVMAIGFLGGLIF